MNKHYLISPFVLIFLCCSASISYACNPKPTPVIDGPDKRYVYAGNTVEFDGDYPDHSYDNDEGGISITEYDWDFPSADEVTAGDTGRPIVKWNSPGGPYVVQLMVKDNEGQWSIGPDTCTVWVIKVDLVISGVDEEDEDDPGKYIAVNSDDDNENSTQDKNDDGTVDNEDDLVEISLSLEPSTLNEGCIKLQAADFGVELIRVWTDQTKGTQLNVIDPTDPEDPTHAIWDLSQESFPTTLWVEGYQYSFYYYGGLRLEYNVYWDTVVFNPVEVQLVMDGVTEDTEEFPGNYILYNKNDNDDDGVPDYDDGFNKDGIPGNEDDENIFEEDLVKITLGNAQPYNKLTGTVTFDVTSGGSKVKIWEPNEYYPLVPQIKYKEISLPLTYNTPTTPLKTFYVEGIEESGAREVEFKLSYTVDGLTIEDIIKATIVHVELFRDSAYTQPLDDWPKIPGEDLLRSAKYIFGEDDPIYVQVKNIGINPDIAETIYDVIFVDSQSGGPIYMDLKETGVNTEIFRNSIADRGELLYLSTEDIDDYPVTMYPDKITVINEEVLNFYLVIPPVYGMYKRSVDVMIDRAEIGVEWQMNYEGYTWGLENIPTWFFSQNLYNAINEKTGITWFKNFNYSDLDSKKSHWHYQNDSYYADSVDIAAWAGHCSYDSEYAMHEMLFFKDNIPYIPEPVDKLTRCEIDWGDKDADWLIIHTCVFLHGTDEQLKYLVDSEPGFRCAHLICGFDGPCYFKDGTYFADQLGEMSIKQAWFDYCQEKQPKNVGVIAKVFGAQECMDDSLAGPGPIETSRDPTIESTWTSEIHPVIEE